MAQIEFERMVNLPRPASDWLTRANRIRADLDTTRYGDKQALLERHAEETGKVVATLKKEVSAAEFISQITDFSPKFGRDLRKLGVAAVVEIARLYKEDKEAAYALASETASGKRHWTDVRKFRADSKFVLANRLRQEVGTVFLSHLNARRDEFGLVSEVPTTFVGASAAYTLEHGGLACAAVQLVEDDTPQDRLTRYLALLALYDLVLLAINSDSIPSDWRSTLRSIRHSPERLRMFGVKGGAVLPLVYV